MTARQGGMTLIELLIAMTLLAFIVGLLFAGFRLASTSWDSVDAHAQRTADAQLARAALRRILTTLQPMRRQEAGRQVIAFEGAATTLRAVGPLATHGEAASLRTFEIAIVAAPATSGSRARLVIRQAPFKYDGEPPFDAIAVADERVLLDDLAEARFEYFGSPSSGVPAQWQDHWPDGGRLPDLIRVAIRSVDPGWPDVVVAPLISGGNCTLDLSFNLRCG